MAPPKFDTQMSLRLLVLAAGLGALAAAAATDQACEPAAGNAHDQLLRLSRLVDPSGRLAKLVADFHQAEHVHPAPGAQKAPEEPVKRSAAAAETATDAPADASTQPPAPAAATTQPPAPTTTTGASASVSAPAATGPAANSSAAPTTLAPGAKPTEASNVTVNVFLQLVPDAKTEELVSICARAAYPSAPLRRPANAR